MKKINKFFVIIFLFTIITSGCFDSKDINEKAILTAVAIDKKNDEIYLYAEIANIEGGSKSESKSENNSNKYIYVKGHGKTITEARENINRKLDKVAFLSTIRTLIITENFAKEHLIEYLYRVRVVEQYRKKTSIVITNDNPDDLFKVINEKEVSVGFSTERLLTTLEETGMSFTRSTSRIIENLSEKYTCFLLPNIGLQGKEIPLIGYSIVNDSAVDGFIPIEKSKGILLIKESNPTFLYTVPYKDNNFTIEVKLKNKKIKPSYINNKISFDLKFNFETKLLYGDKKTPYNFNTKSNTEVTKILENKLKNEIEMAIKTMNEQYNCDYLQFNEEFRINFPVEFNKMNWENELPKITYNIDTKVLLKSKWTMDYETNQRK